MHELVPQYLRPELLLAYASALITGDFDATALQPETLTELGADPVGSGPDPIGDALREDGSGTSKMDKASESVMNRDGMSQAERDAYAEALRHPEEMRESTVGAEGLKGKKIIMSDGPGGGEFRSKEFVVDLPPDTKVLVGTYTYIGPDGREYEETFYIFPECANPAVDAAPDVPKETVTPVPAPTPECPPGGTTVSRELYDGSTVISKEERDALSRGEENLIIPEDEKIPVVTVKDMPPDGLHQDLNGDGNGREACADSPVGEQWDEVEDKATGETQQEILPGITKERIADDIRYFEEKYGYTPKYIVYDVTDCNGRNVVACWDVKEEKWGIVYADGEVRDPRSGDRFRMAVDEAGNPIREWRGTSSRGEWKWTGKLPHTIDTHDELMAFLNQQGGTKK